jgi:hypothetical protein
MLIHCAPVMYLIPAIQNFVIPATSYFVIPATSYFVIPATSYFVIPAKAGIHWLLTVAKWIPAFAGMTIQC